MKTNQLEILESRIAPASFLVTSNALLILDSALASVNGRKFVPTRTAAWSSGAW